MEILGIGPSELVFILLIAIIILGPKDMQKAGKTIGRWLNRFVHSDGWKALQRATREIQNLPTNLMREANLEELKEINKDIQQNIDSLRPAVTTAVSASQNPSSTAPKTEVPPSNQAETPPQPPAETSDTPSESTEQQ